MHSSQCFHFTGGEGDRREQRDSVGLRRRRGDDDRLCLCLRALRGHCGAAAAEGIDLSHDRGQPESGEEGEGVLLTQVYRVSHLLVDLGWVDFDLGVPPSCSAAQPLLKNFHQPR